MALPFHQFTLERRRLGAALVISVALHLLLGGLLVGLVVPKSELPARHPMTVTWISDDRPEAPRKKPEPASSATERHRIPRPPHKTPKQEPRPDAVVAPRPIQPTPTSLPKPTPQPATQGTAASQPLNASPGNGKTSPTKRPVTSPGQAAAKAFSGEAGGTGAQSRGTQQLGGTGGADGSSGDGDGQSASSGTGGAGNAGEGGTGQEAGGAGGSSEGAPALSDMPPADLVADAPLGHFSLGEPKWAVTPEVLKGILGRLATARRAMAREVKGLGSARTEVRFRLDSTGSPREIQMAEASTPAPVADLARRLLEKGAPYPLPVATTALSASATVAIRPAQQGLPAKVVLVHPSGNPEFDQAVLALSLPATTDSAWYLRTISVQATLATQADPAFEGTLRDFQGDAALRPWAQAQAARLYQNTETTGVLRLPLVIEER